MGLRNIRAEWNKKHRELIPQGSEIRNEKMADWCEALIIEAKQAYYNTDAPIMTDEEFDMLERNLKTLRPGSKILEKVGT